MQSTARDRGLSAIQLFLYPVITAVVPYGFARAETNMAQRSYSELPSQDTRMQIWNLLDRLRRWYSLAAFLNFGLFLSNGKSVTSSDFISVFERRLLNTSLSFETRADTVRLQIDCSV